MLSWIPSLSYLPNDDNLTKYNLDTDLPICQWRD